MENTKYGKRREGRWTPIRAKAQDTRANPNSWETHLVRKRWDIGLLRALSLRIMMMMMMIVSIHLYSASCSAHQSEALPVRETQREESSLERTKKRHLAHQLIRGSMSEEGVGSNLILFIAFNL